MQTDFFFLLTGWQFDISSLWGWAVLSIVCGNKKNQINYDVIFRSFIKLEKKWVQKHLWPVILTHFHIHASGSGCVVTVKQHKGTGELCVEQYLLSHPPSDCRSISGEGWWPPVICVWISAAHLRGDGSQVVTAAWKAINSKAASLLKSTYLLRGRCFICKWDCLVTTSHSNLFCPSPPSAGVHTQSDDVLALDENKILNEVLSFSGWTRGDCDLQSSSALTPVFFSFFFFVFAQTSELHSQAENPWRVLKVGLRCCCVCSFKAGLCAFRIPRWEAWPACAVPRIQGSSPTWRKSEC